MEINTPFSSTTLSNATGKTTLLSLRIDQEVQATIIKVGMERNVLTLQVANQSLRVNSDVPLNVSAGQLIDLKLIKLQPLPEFKLINPSPRTLSGMSDKPLTDIILRTAFIDSGLLAEKPQPWLQQLSIGQRLQVTVTDLGYAISGQSVVLGAKPEPSHPISLQVSQIINPLDGKNRTSAQLSIADQGRTVILEVVKSGDTPLFKIVSGENSSLPESIIGDVAKRLLPIQQSSATLVNHLLLTIDSLTEKATIPETLKRLAQEILQQLPRRSQMGEAETLKQQILNSGRFLEAHLAQSSQDSTINLHDDMKLKLLRLVDALQQQVDPKAEQKLPGNELNLLKELLQKSHGALAKLIIDQLNSLPKEEGQKQTWFVELPFIERGHADQMTIELERGKRGESPEEKTTWSVIITLTPPSLGTIQCRIHCHDNSISTRFFSDREYTVATLNRHLEILKQNFEANGITPGVMEARFGRPKQPVQRLTDGENLLNEQA